jgi:hypothetical protein
VTKHPFNADIVIWASQTNWQFAICETHIYRPETPSSLKQFGSAPGNLFSQRLGVPISLRRSARRAKWWITLFYPYARPDAPNIELSSFFKAVALMGCRHVRASRAIGRESPPSEKHIPLR